MHDFHFNRLMNERYIKRSLEPVLIRATTEFPAVVLTGPLCGVHSNDVSCSFTEDIALFPSRHEILREYQLIHCPPTDMQFCNAHRAIYESRLLVRNGTYSLSLDIL